MIPRRELLKRLQRVYNGYMDAARFYRKASMDAKKKGKKEDYDFFDGLYLGYLGAAQDIKEFRRIYELL